MEDEFENSEELMADMYGMDSYTEVLDQAQDITMDMIRGLFPDVDGLEPTKVENIRGVRREYYGNFHYRMLGSYEVSTNHIYAREYDKNGMVKKEMFMLGNSYGESPDGHAVLYTDGIPYAYCVSRALATSDEYFTSNRIYFKPDGTVDRNLTRLDIDFCDFRIESLNFLRNDIRKSRKVMESASHKQHIK